MFRFLMLFAILLSAEAASAAPPPSGLWLTQDRGGVIAVDPCDDKLCARIAGIVLDHPTDPTPVDYRGVSQCHLPLIDDAVQTGPNMWRGHITDPRNGSVYRVQLSMQGDGTLALPGYLGIPLLGQTEIWTRYTGGLPNDCRLTKPDADTIVTQQRGRPAG
jgi:uncharacterized protein (DUF2147 family)